MAIKTVDLTLGANHGAAQNLRGWSVQGTVVLRLRKLNVTGAVLAIVENSGAEVFSNVVDAQGGTYVELVSGTLTEGILYYD